ncbi:hypothetical protein [Virgibacillus indicus]|uniref:hypothetical protein n=1 Tax=Virgibacillus indicus TaxID=2024554 RepID=UPI0013FDE713|nr:hypothetical protein [Virgibacillus indicus]
MKKKIGWKKGERAGASVQYIKEKYKIDLISTTNQLDIISSELKGLILDIRKLLT